MQLLVAIPLQILQRREQFRFEDAVICEAVARCIQITNQERKALVVHFIWRAHLARPRCYQFNRGIPRRKWPGDDVAVRLAILDHPFGVEEADMYGVARADVIPDADELKAGGAVRLEIEAGEGKDHFAPLSCKWLRWEVMTKSLA